MSSNDLPYFYIQRSTVQPSGIVEVRKMTSQQRESAAASGGKCSGFAEWGCRRPEYILVARDPSGGVGADGKGNLYGWACDKCAEYLRTKHGLEPKEARVPHIHAGTRRSLVVFIHDACPFNGQEYLGTSSIGVYFGPNSTHNISKRIDSGPTPTNQSGEIAAALEAMRHVRQAIEPSRRTMIRNTLPENCRENRRRDIRNFCLVLATDSSYLVECLCKHIEKWTLTGNVYKNERGQIVKNGEGFAQIDAEVDALSRVGVQVEWYHVPKECNKEANRLAQTAL
ncbi:hypothetical protein F4677DRAFT_450552 [Hypoxylon crocopeplum]|nr:hypothetical protein F4677DRAFT_450552 [Hypoxylon crocopeplum]